MSLYGVSALIKTYRSCLRPCADAAHVALQACADVSVSIANTRDATQTPKKKSIASTVQLYLWRAITEDKIMLNVSRSNRTNQISFTCIIT